VERQATGTVAIGAVHARLTFRGEPWPFYVLVLNDGQIFLSHRQPSLYAADASLIVTREIPPTSIVRVRYREVGGIRWMSAVQVIRQAEDQSPFSPVSDDGAG
jgi:hypothetical protein